MESKKTMSMKIPNLRELSECKGQMKKLIGEKHIMDLVKNYNCPHYVLTNPISNKPMILFNSSELEEWLSQNFLKKVDAMVPLVENYNFTFLHFDREKMRAKGDIPMQLSSIKDLYEIPLENLVTPPGIYFLCLDGNIEYIGRSENIIMRTSTHIKEGIKKFDSIYFITCPPSRLSELEANLIKFYKPPLNRTSKRGDIEPMLI